MIETDSLVPEIELKARDYISQGYQRLLTYEVDGGGFEWFGETPAHFVLTSYGLLEFVDMAEVYEVDPDIITRTAKWMVSLQESDGSFKPTSGGIPEGAINNFENSVLRTTAYGAWALARAEKEDSARSKAVTYLESHADEATDNYSVAMTAMAILMNEGSTTVIDTLIDKLVDSKVEDEKGAVHWSQDVQTETYSSGSSADIETTALIGLLLIQRGGHTTLVQQILSWITGQKDSFGNWQTTQGTVLALRFMIESLQAEASETNATVTVSANGGTTTTIEITPETSDILSLVDLKEDLIYGKNTVDITFSGTGQMMYQAVSTWYVPGENAQSQGPLSIDVTYDKTELKVNDTVGVEVKVTNTSAEGVSVILASIGLPPGFTLIPDQLETAVADGTYLQKYETTPRQIIFYINHIAAGNTATFNYELLADYPMNGSTGESSVNPYYTPLDKDLNEAQVITVSE